MTAQEYLEELQSVYRHYHYLLELVQDRRDLFARNKVRPPTADKDIPRYARELAAATIIDVLPNDTAKELRDKLEYDVASHIARTRPELGWAQRAHSQFLSHASDMAKDLFTQNLDIAVGVLETASFNASAIPVPERERSWVIALNQEVSTVVYEVARTIAGTFNVRIGKAVGNEALSPKRAGRILHERLNHYMHMGIPYGNEYKVSREQIVLASNVTTMAERFVYAHELSHIILGHHVGAPLRALPDDWSEAVETVHEMDQEQEADLLAWELLTRVFVGSMGEFQMAYAGSFMFLRVADLLERAAEVVAVSTHPPASQRLVYLTEGAQRTAKEAGISFEQVASIQRGMSDHLERVLQEMPALPGGCPLEELLNRAASSDVPDYMSFQNEAFTLLSHGAPSKLCRALGRAYGKAEKDLRKLGIIMDESPGGSVGPPNPATLKAARQPFNKLKLVGGLLWLYLIPEISRFVERHRDEYLKEESDD